MKVYLVEDDPNLNDLLTFNLKEAGFEVMSFLNGRTVNNHISDGVDLWVLDIMLPDTDGYSILKKIRAIDDEVPVIFVSARDSDIDRVMGLEFGGDDYITKPFLPRELVLRIERLLGRKKTKDKVIKIGSYAFDLTGRVITVEGQVIDISSKEFDLVQVLLTNENHAFSRDDLLNLVWGDDYFGSDRVVDDLVRRIRKKLPDLKIETIYGFGYRWCRHDE